MATSDNVEKADGLLYHNVFKFRADFKAGDEVRVVVESEGMRAEAAAVALDAPVIAGVDTTHLYKKSSKGSDYIKTLGMGVHVKDKPGEKNYYMLQAWNFGYAYNKQLEIDNSSEPLLNPGINLSFPSPIISPMSTIYSLTLDSRVAPTYSKSLCSGAESLA